jgi:hypothetical protein
MDRDEKRTGLGTNFVKEVIENNDYEYCNRSKAEAAANLADNYAMAFAEWRLTCLIKNADQYTMRELLDIFKSQKELS